MAVKEKTITRTDDSVVLPDGWRRMKFGDVVRDVKVTVDPETSGIERYVAGEHMNTDDLHIRSWGTIGDGYLGPAFHRKFVKGQVLYGSRRTYLRKVAIAEFDGICANTTFVLEPKSDDLLPELLPFIMQTESFSTHAVKQSRGSVNPYVNFKDIAWYEFALPPKGEQHRIANILWTANSAIQANQTLLEQMILAKRAISHEIIHYGLKTSLEKNLPRRGMCEIGDFLANEDVRNGLYKPASAYGDGTPIIRIDSFQDGETVNLQLLKRVRISGDECTAFQVNKGDVLVNRVNSLSHLGKTAIVPSLDETTVFESNMMCLRFRPESGILPEYALLLLSSPEAKRQMLARAKKAIAQSSINQSDVRSLRFPIPPVKEQQQIVMVIHQAQSFIDKVQRHLETMQGLKKELLHSLLKS